MGICPGDFVSDCSNCQSFLDQYGLIRFEENGLENGTWIARI